MLSRTKSIARFASFTIFCICLLTPRLNAKPDNLWRELNCKEQSVFLQYKFQTGSTISELFIPHKSVGNDFIICKQVHLYTEDEYSGTSNVETGLSLLCLRTPSVYDVYHVCLPTEKEDIIVFHYIICKTEKDSATIKFLDKRNSSGLDEFACKVANADNLLLKKVEALYKVEKLSRAEELLRVISILYREGGRKSVKKAFSSSLTESSDWGKRSNRKAKESENSAHNRTDSPEPSFRVQNNKRHIVTAANAKAGAVSRTGNYVRISWTLDITNSSSELVDFLPIHLNILNKEGLSISDSSMIVQDLDPQETRKVIGKDLITTEEWSRVSNFEFVIAP